MLRFRLNPVEVATFLVVAGVTFLVQEILRRGDDIAILEDQVHQLASRAVEEI